MLQTVVGMGALWVGVDTYRNTLKEANIEANLVPLHGCPAHENEQQ